MKGGGSRSALPCEVPAAARGSSGSSSGSVQNKVDAVNICTQQNCSAAPTGVQISRLLPTSGGNMAPKPAN